MEFDLDRVRSNVRNATTEDLLDRATVYRPALEPDALPVILEELRARGVTADSIVRHEETRQGAVLDRIGYPRQCSRCRKPAVTSEWGWHRLFDKLPIFPRLYFLCKDHRTSRDFDEHPVKDAS